MDLNENEIVEIVIGAAIGIHRDLGPGLLESVYERVLTRVLFEKGLRVDVQRVIPLVYRGENLGDAFRADMIINEKVIVELKSVRAIEDVFLKQVLTYLKLTGLRLGLLINFNEALLKNGIKRVVCGILD